MKHKLPHHMRPHLFFENGWWKCRTHRHQSTSRRTGFTAYASRTPEGAYNYWLEKRTHAVKMQMLQIMPRLRSRMPKPYWHAAR